MLVVTQDGLHTLRTDEIIGFFDKDNSLWCRTYDQGELLIGEYDSQEEYERAYADYRFCFKRGEKKFIFPKRGFLKDFHVEGNDYD